MDAIEQVLAKYPNLCADGLNGDEQHRLSPKAVQLCIEWLLKHDALNRRKTVNTKMSSYNWKHIVQCDANHYVSNGDFICAALYLGYKMRRTLRNDLNAYFNIRDVE